ncbi:MAG: hypothetical protein ACRDJW_18105 [Thermomicrobiales bacterium]
MSYALLYKRKSYEHEREARAMCFPYYHLHKPPASSEIAVGTQINVDLNTLIDKIYVAPESPGWLYSLVKKVASTYGLDPEQVTSSSLDAPALF